MARLNFVRGSIKGRVGQFVGSSWRGKEYIKTYTAPGNPKTEGQQAVRGIFLHTSQIAKAIYQGVLKPFTFPRPVKLTAYNRMIQANKELFESLEWDQTKLRIFDGPLFNPGIASASVSGSGASAVVNVSFDASQGAGTDKAIAVIHDEATESTLYTVGTRTDATLAVSLAGIDQTDLTKLHAYLVFAKEPAPDTGEPGEVSGTAYYKVA
jgi:hypothetical protein